jgi:hypothetical protein
MHMLQRKERTSHTCQFGHIRGLHDGFRITRYSNGVSKEHYLFIFT